MSDDWKKKIDNKYEADKKTKEQYQKSLTSLVTRNKIYKEDLLLAVFHLMRFKCHICGKRSEYPLTTEEDIPGTGGLAMDGDHSSNMTIKTVHYFTPGDLERCNCCNEWTCGKHIYKGICQTCAEKL